MKKRKIFFLRKIWFSIKKLKVEIFIGFFGIASAFLSYIYINNSKYSFILILSVLLPFLSLLTIIILRTREQQFYYLTLTREKDKYNWIGKGKFGYDRNNDSFFIEGRSTNVGDFDSTFIYKECLQWSDYRFSFEFKIENCCLGVVIRAINLYNYIMLQIHKVGINPHIKLNGRWKEFPFDQEDLIFNSQLSLHKWYRCLIICDNINIDINIFDKNKTIMSRNWKIPSEVEFEAEYILPNNIVQRFKIRNVVNLDFGSIGFRNSRTKANQNNRDEKSLIRDFLIEKI